MLMVVCTNIVVVLKQFDIWQGCISISVILILIMSLTHRHKWCCRINYLFPLHILLPQKRALKHWNLMRQFNQTSRKQIWLFQKQSRAKLFSLWICGSSTHNIVLHRHCTGIGWDLLHSWHTAWLANQISMLVFLFVVGYPPPPELVLPLAEGTN